MFCVKFSFYVFFKMINKLKKNFFLKKFIKCIKKIHFLAKVTHQQR
jgi:hypothetical protein